MSVFEEMFGDYLNAYKNTSQYKDGSMLDIAQGVFLMMLKLTIS